MATVQDLKRRIRSIRNTRKITKAMELVASARLRRAQARIEAMRPYADRMMELMVGTARASTSLQGLTLLQRREVQRAAIVPLTGDRGLAGAFNAQVLRHAFAVERQLRADGVDVPSFLQELRDFLRAEESILKQIRETGDLPDELRDKLDEELKRFAKGFKATEEAPAAA